MRSTFDADVRRDFDRIKAALKASGVNSHRFDASVTADGVLSDVRFRIDDHSIEWNWFYVFDPHDALPKNAQGPNTPRYERINARWWLVTEIDD